MKLTETELKCADKIVGSGKYPTRSSLLRHGLGKIFEQEGITRVDELRIEKERAVHKPSQGQKKKAKRKRIKAKVEDMIDDAIDSLFDQDS
jgi:Arc/MetJ-type ribon-helix-helix transcriptional regulator